MTTTSWCVRILSVATISLSDLTSACQPKDTAALTIDFSTLLSVFLESPYCAIDWFSKFLIGTVDLQPIRKNHNYC